MHLNLHIVMTEEKEVGLATKGICFALAVVLAVACLYVFKCIVVMFMAMGV